MKIVQGFRHFSSNSVSSRQVVTEISNIASKSNVQQLGMPSVVSLTSKRPVKKRVTVDDRKAMLESFVNKYRAMNLGKFPTAKSAQKEVGGGYYFIRKMLQEMEYNSKLSSVEGLVKKNKPQITGENFDPQQQEAKDPQLNRNARPESVRDFDSNFELEGLPPSTSGDAKSSNITRDDIHSSATKTGNIEGLCDEKPQHKVKEESPQQDKLDLFDSERKVIRHEHAALKTTTRDASQQQKDGGVREKPSSVWGNLKSMATSFINIWRKQR